MMKTLLTKKSVTMNKELPTASQEISRTEIPFQTNYLGHSSLTEPQKPKALAKVTVLRAIGQKKEVLNITLS